MSAAEEEGAVASETRSLDTVTTVTTAFRWRRERWWLLLLFLAAVLPRLVGLEAGLPLVLNPDELMSLGFARAIDVSGDLRGQPWRYPPLLGDTMYALMKLLRGAGGCDGACTDSQVLMLGRGVSVLASSLGVVAIYAASRMAGVARVWSGVAALVLAWSPTFVFMGRYATPDALATGGVCASVMCLVAIAGGRGRGWYLAAALALGITGGAKYNAGLIATSVVMAHLASTKRWTWLPWMALTAAGALAVFVLTLLPPWAGVEPILEGLGYEWRHYGRGHGGFASPHAGADALRYLIVFTWGVVPSVVLFLGALLDLRSRDVAARRRRGIWLALGLFVIGYLVMVGRGDMFVDRVLLPVLPAMGLLLGLAVQAVVAAAHPRLAGERKRIAVGVALAASLVVASALRTADQAQALAQEDTRLAAQRWISATLDPKHTKIAVLPNSAMGLFKGLKGYDIRAVKRVSAGGFRRAGITHVVFGIGSYQRYARSPERFPAQAEEVAGHQRALAEGAQQVIVFEAPLPPGANRFGTTTSIYHQYAVEIWAL